MKKIIIFARFLGCGGTEKAMVSLLNAIDYNLYDVTLKLLEKDDFYLEQVPKNVHISYFKFKNKIHESVVMVGNFLEKIVLKCYKIFYNIKDNEIEKLHLLICKSSEINNEKYDIALDFHSYGYFFTTYAANFINANKKAMWIHDEKMVWLKGIENSLSKYDKIFCVSKSVKNNFDTLYPQYKYKSEVFYNIIDTKDIIKNAELFKPNFNEDCCNIVTVGRLVAEKGYDFAIEVASKLKKANFKFCWYFIGEGSQKNKLQNLISKYGLGNNVIMLGKQSNPYPYIKAADIYVQPSRHEGYGITIHEARVLKKIIIASNIDAVSEQISDNVNGYLLNFDSDLYVKKIIEIYNNPDLVKNIKKYMENEKIDFSDEIKKIDSLLI